MIGDDVIPSASRFAVVPTCWLRHPELNPTDKAVLAVLSTYASTERFCYPGVRTLSRQLNVAERTVQYALRRLEEVGALVVERRTRGDGSATSNGYWITGYDLSDRPILQGVVQPIAPPPVQPIAPHEQEQLEQETSTSATPPRARGLFATLPPGLPPAYRLAYEALRETAKNPIAYDATLGAALEGMHGKQWSPEDVGQTLLDLWANGEGWNAGLFRAYLQRHARAVERHAALEAEQQTAQTVRARRASASLIPEEWRQKAEADLARAAGGNG